MQCIDIAKQIEQKTAQFYSETQTEQNMHGNVNQWDLYNSAADTDLNITLYL